MEYVRNYVQWAWRDSLCNHDPHAAHHHNHHTSTYPGNQQLCTIKEQFKWYSRVRDSQRPREFKIISASSLSDYFLSCEDQRLVILSISDHCWVSGLSSPPAQESCLLNWYLQPTVGEVKATVITGAKKLFSFVLHYKNHPFNSTMINFFTNRARQQHKRTNTKHTVYVTQIIVMPVSFPTLCSLNVNIHTHTFKHRCQPAHQKGN